MNAIAIARQPATARLDDAGRRIYTWTGRGHVEEFWSVTTMLGLGVPKYLVPWASKLVAELAVDEMLSRGPHSRSSAVLRRWARAGRELVEAAHAAGLLKTIKLEKLTDRDLALRYLKGHPDRVRDLAGEKGTDVHTAAEDLVLANLHDAERIYIAGDRLPEYDARIAPHMASFVHWLNTYRPHFLATEATVFNRSQVYAGTGDAWAEVKLERRWTPLCIDYKSGRAIYSDVAMQCCAYARGEFIGSPDRVTELEVPGVAGTAVLHLTPDGPVFRRLRFDEQVWRSFLYVREVFRWAIDLADTAIGEPIPQDVEDALEASLERVS